MGSTFYLFYMVLFTGGVLWCLFLWLVKDEEEEEDGEKPPVDPPSPGASSRSSLDDRPAPSPAGYGDTSLPPGEVE